MGPTSQTFLWQVFEERWLASDSQVPQSMSVPGQRQAHALVLTVGAGHARVTPYALTTRITRSREYLPQPCPAQRGFKTGAEGTFPALQKLFLRF